MMSMSASRFGREGSEMRVRDAPRRRRIVATVATLIAALLMSACGGTSLEAGERGYITGLGVVDPVAVVDRVELPTIEGGTLDGDSFDSRNYLGKVLVINVWGSWCPPCREEAPALRKVSEETRDQDVQFVGIDVRDNDAAALAFERRYKITYPSITTADSGPAMLAFGSVLPRNAIPSTLVVDRRGRVAARVIGRTTYVTLRELVTEALAEPDG
jgi:thiol-disulfide isomerase/thioredoxin